MSQPCNNELSASAPTISTCPQDNELLLFLNVAGVLGGYAFRSWATVRQCLLAKLTFAKTVITPGTPGQPVLGATQVTVNQTNVIVDSVWISLGGVVLPVNDNTQISYTIAYSAGGFTVTFNQGFLVNQKYVINYAYSQ